MKLPQRVIVGYRTYRVETWPAVEASGAQRLGESCHMTGIIKIRGDLPVDQLANTLFHEILHACWYVGDLADADNQERTVSVLANQITQVWRDNPHLIEWFESVLKQQRVNQWPDQPIPTGPPAVIE